MALERNDLPLDAVDRRILTELQRDGRLSNVELAERVRLSPSPCLRRLKRLEREGFIAGYQARLDRRRVGLGLTVFVDLRVEVHSDPSLLALEEAVQDVDEIVACHTVSGASDFMLEVVAADLEHYERLLRGVLLSLPGVIDVRSNFALRTMKAAGPLPLTTV